MRAYRFVAYLGSEVTDAGRSVAESAHVEFDHSGGLAAEGADTPSERVGQELLRQIARRLDADEHERVEFSARALAPVRPEKRATSSPGGDLGLVLQIELPGFEQTNALIAKSVYRPSIGASDLPRDGSQLRERVRTRLETTPSVYLLVVSDSGVRVISGHAVAAVREPLDHETFTELLYSKDLGRFAMEFAEGFIGDSRLTDGFQYPDGNRDLDRELRAWASEYGLQGVLLLRVSLAPNREPASLRDFV